MTKSSALLSSLASLLLRVMTTFQGVIAHVTLALQSRLLARQAAAREAQQALHDRSQMSQQHMLSCATHLADVHQQLLMAAFKDQQPMPQQQHCMPSTPQQRGAGPSSAAGKNGLLHSSVCVTYRL